jgi:transcriptional regulator with XRE-family HTH domain
MTHESLNVGRRMRALREQNGLSLRALAEACDLSVNAISMIERGESSPRVSSLHLLAKALNVRITEFFESENRCSVVHVRRSERPLTYSDELSIESVGSGLRNQQLEPFVVTIGAGDSSGERVEHPGEEFVYCLRGSLEYTVAGEVFALQVGDSLLFDATQPHSFQNTGNEDAEILLILQAADGTGIGKARHMPSPSSAAIRATRDRPHGQ